MNLIKTSFLSLIASIFKISYGLILNKLMAVYVGPSGVALVGQFQSVQAGLMGIATAGIGQGVTKYISEFKGRLEESIGIFATAVKLVVTLLLLLMLIMTLFSGKISALIFGSVDYSHWVVWLSIAMVPASIGTLCMATLNGLHEIRRLTVVGVLSSVSGIILGLLLVPLWGISGAIVALLLVPVVTFIISAYGLINSHGFATKWFHGRANMASAKKLGKFTIMSVASAVSIPVSHILIRNYLSDSVSLDAAGLWTGAWRVSEAYLMVITMTLSVYYLPRLSSLNGQIAIRKEIRHGQLYILPFVVVSAFLIYLMKDWVILLLFDERFAGMGELFAFQLIGDVIKIAAWLYGYVYLAKAQVGVFIFVEIFFSALFVILVVLLVNKYGLVGVTYAFALNYTVCYAFQYGWFKRCCKKGVFEEGKECVK